jgi:hypothetical protein
MVSSNYAVVGWNLVEFWAVGVALDGCWLGLSGGWLGLGEGKRGRRLT